MYWLCCGCCQVASVVSDSVQHHRRQPTRLPHLWDSPGKNTGVGCHFLLQCMKVKSESEVAQSCLTLSNPMDCSLPGSSAHGSSPNPTASALASLPLVHHGSVWRTFIPTSLTQNDLFLFYKFCFKRLVFPPLPNTLIKTQSSSPLRALFLPTGLG